MNVGLSKKSFIMYAVLKTGGKQYRVSENDIIIVEKLSGEAGSTIDLDAVSYTHLTLPTNREV